MNDMTTIDIQTYVSNTVRQVFDTMLAMDIQIFAKNPPSLPDGFRFVGTVAFTGEVSGCVNLQINDVFARLLTANLLGITADDIEGSEEVEDVIGELSNMIGGDLKSRFCDLDLPCELSVPTIASGEDFKIEPVGLLRRESIGIGYQEHIAQVQVFLK
jgi:chemotaxis protein CheX